MTIIDVRGLGLMAKGKPILQDISFSLEAGERVTLVGPSGSGKSSLLKLLAGLKSPDQGQIHYEGKNLEDLDLVAYRREVSYCFQQPVLFGQTVFDNLNFPFELRQQPFDRQRVLAALEQVNLSESFLDQAVSDLSGGEKQRVALIRNLLFEPKVLLLDEVTAGLDAKTKALVHHLIASYHQSGKTIIEVTHDAEEIRSAQRLVTIEGGQLIHD